MAAKAKPTAVNDPLKALRTKVQTLRRKVEGLGDEDDWRDWLAQIIGKRSLRAMSEGELKAVVRALHDAGAPRRPTGRRARFADTPQMKMIRGLWLDLADLEAVRDRTEAAIGAFVRRQTGQDVGRLDVASADRVIEALKSWRARVQEEPRS
ncbi:regulatory protein GemA (plasmid) [Azospirillum argentinense]|uniref:Regulatory protein GemA n=1 Tax=Azospirillum argentinense TaxID=2970906 RepID=A0A4D8PSQ4_9PROT|nr:regulatory protein GemA [Azospirillum argentinense]QCN98898.1 regulatory protein GemA [Azospirillum argentinense]QCN99469.1 regulatory protein GemA [Azospirillum argentinense]